MNTADTREVLLHSLTQQQLEAFATAPAHALLLLGPRGSGKGTLAVQVAETVLQLSAGQLANHPYALLIAPETDGKAIGIEAVRQLEQFLALKVPGQQTGDYNRAVIIENAQLLTLEAQNALLKLLEEPPDGTLLILSADHAQSLLPTIRSRAQAITVNRLEQQAVEQHFMEQGFDRAAVAQAYAVSGGLPGLMHALLHDDEHPLRLATERARQLLSQTAYERHTMVDELAKQRSLALDVTTILQQMAHLSLQTATGPAAKKWQAVLTAAYRANEALTANAQPKLVLTRLMLSL
ncbi:MAG TPA: AAA family ATPase [Candidatus Saccharimonadales bacterium]|nr:AAA family ATPase [Candidatus Saccharimonadales bacterium]